MRRRIGLARARRRLAAARLRLATAQGLYDAHGRPSNLHDEAFARLMIVALQAEVEDASKAVARLER